MARHEAQKAAAQRKLDLGAALQTITQACSVTGTLTNLTRETFWKVENGAVYAWKALNPSVLARVLDLEKMVEALKAQRIFPAEAS